MVIDVDRESLAVFASVEQQRETQAGDSMLRNYLRSG